MSELIKHEVQSPELEEIMTEIPGNFLKLGLFIFFAIILILIIGCYFIKSPEIVTVPVIITTQNPPVNLVAKVGGEIEKLYIAEGSLIKPNEMVALIKNPCNYDHVKILKIFLSSFNNKTDWINRIKTLEFPSELSLGEIQNNYSQFEKELKQMKDYVSQAYIPSKLNLLNRQIQIKTEYNIELVKQQRLLCEDLLLARNSFYRDSVLYFKNSYTISTNEYEKSRQSYVQKLFSFSLFNGSLKNNEADSLRMRENQLDLEIQYEKELNQFVIALEESLQVLRSTISEWEMKYVIKSPIYGVVTLNHFRNINQVIKPGEILATIIPDSITRIIVRAIIPVSGFGRIEIGQPVNIKLSGFPYMIYGVLRGRILSFSQVPDGGGFSADIVLTGGMTSTYSEKIRFIHEMSGSADIITSESRLIFRFIKPLKSVITAS